MFGRYLNFVTLWPITCAFLRTKVQKRRSSRVLHLSFQRDVRTEQRARTRTRHRVCNFCWTRVVPSSVFL